MRWYAQALEVRKGYAEAYLDMGTAYRAAGKPAQAEECYRKALELKSDMGDAHINIGLLFQDKNESDEAIASYDCARESKRCYANAHWNRSLAKLLRGDFESGWPEYDRCEHLHNHPGKENRLMDERSSCMRSRVMATRFNSSATRPS
jgi:Tfp pilus assembly protein PilF